MPKSKICSARQLHQIAQEFIVLKKLDHPNVVAMYNFLHGEQNLYLFMEMVGRSSLFNAIAGVGPGGLPWAAAECYMRQISRGLAHCHARGIAHCDLKPENIVISDGHSVKIV